MTLFEMVAPALWLGHLLLQTPIGDPDRFNGFLLFGYAAMAVIAIAYILYLYSQQRNITQDVQLLQKLLDERTAAAAQAHDEPHQ